MLSVYIDNVGFFVSFPLYRLFLNGSKVEIKGVIAHHVPGSTWSNRSQNVVHAANRRGSEAMTQEER